ncbi:MAG: metalloregulator ArsR/SmtB family transcription factor [Parvibaculaceae bacterium]|nr:metalloregulator ArsR/SmtB family transcription factor [Parvibaculaceae bacterium]
MAKLDGIKEIKIADEVFAALAHPMRRQILLSIHLRGETKAGDIAARFDCAWPTTSRHLSTLVESGLLRVEKQGRERVYMCNSALLSDVLDRWAVHFK